MTTFYLIRHGQKEHTPFDPALTSLGTKQAEATADHLKNISFKEAHVSPKLRTRQTAEIITKPHSLKPKVNDNLVERMEWQSNQTFEEFAAEWLKTDFDRTCSPLAGLGSQANGERMKLIIDDISSKNQDENILIVTHGGSIGDLLRKLFTEEAIEHKIDPITGAKHILISECSITIISKDQDKYTLIQLADNSHIPTDSINN